MSLYLLNYMFHFTDYHLPLRIHYMFLVLLTSSYMYYLLHYLSHLLLYNSLMYTIDNLMLLMNLLHSLYMLSLHFRSLVRYLLLLLLVLRSSMFLLCLHNHLSHYSHLLPSNLLYMFLVHLMSSSMSWLFMMVHL